MTFLGCNPTFAGLPDGLTARLRARRKAPKASLSFRELLGRCIAGSANGGAEVVCINDLQVPETRTKEMPCAVEGGQHCGRARDLRVGGWSKGASSRSFELAHTPGTWVDKSCSMLSRDVGVARPSAHMQGLMRIWLFSCYPLLPLTRCCNSRKGVALLQQL